MGNSHRPTGLAKRLAFTAIMVATPAVAAMLLVAAYYGYRKLEENIVYTEPFGRLDDDIGWTLKPRIAARVSHRNRLTGEVYYDVGVVTNGDGFRARAVDEPSAVNAVLAVGDSWTFGVAVDHRDAFPTQLAARLRQPVNNLGVPAHGTAQTILLLERHVERLAPRVVVHVNLGLWARSICRGEVRPGAILKPCFWRDPVSGVVDLVKPPPGHVTAMARFGVFPGGWLTAGHNTWTYYLVSRPVVRLTQLAAQLGLVSGQIAEDDPLPADRAAILQFALGRFVSLADRHDFVFVLFDPPSDYAQAVRGLADRSAGRLIYLDGAVDRAEVAPRVAKIPADRRQVPRDGHFTGAYMAAWVEVLAPRILAAMASAPARPASLPR